MSAIFSEDDGKMYRYRLERIVDDTSPGLTVAGLMVNPSTAGETNNDHTIAKWLGFGMRAGWRKFIIGNKFAFRAKDVKELRTAADPVGPGNDKHIEQILRDADLHIVAWGPLAKLPPRLRDRAYDVLQIARRVGCPLYCWGHAADGQPRHPLMLAYDTPLVKWEWSPTASASFVDVMRGKA